MDPLTIIGLASNIISFIDFSWELITGAQSVYKSVNGTTLENATLETIVADLEQGSQDLLLDIKGTTQNEIALLRLADECLKVSQQLSRILTKLKTKVGKNSKWESVKVKWVSMRKEKDIISLESRLSKYRSEILLRLQFMFGHQQSSIKARLDSIENDAKRLQNEHAKQLQSLRKEILDAVDRLRLSQDQEGQRRLDESQDRSRDHTCSNDISAALFHMKELSASMLSENEILGRLSFPSMYYREDSVENAEAETYQWMTGDAPEEQELEAKKREARESFHGWLRNGTGIYHIFGKAGSGKSTLMKLLCNSLRVKAELRSWAEPHELVFAKFFFWNSGDKLQRSIEGLYRSILFEVLKRFPNLIPQVFPNPSVDFHSLRHGMNLQEFRLEEAKVAFMNLVALFATSDHRICLFIDGLDEYEGDSLDYWSISRDLGSWTTSKNIKMCVASRPYTEFMDSFNIIPGQQIRLHELTESDIRNYCLAMMEKDRNFDRIKESYHELSEEIVHRADGVFLWARLATRTFLSGVGYRDSPQMLHTKLKAIPNGMKNLFDKMLEEVDPASRESSDKLLLLAVKLSSIYTACPAILYSWVDDLQDLTFPYHPQALRYSESNIEDRIETVRYRLDSLSKGLLELHNIESCIYKVKHVVLFFHRTAREYLCESRLKQMEKRNPNFDVNEACCRLLFGYFVFMSMEHEQGRVIASGSALVFLLQVLFSFLSCSPTSSKIVERFQPIWETLFMDRCPISTGTENYYIIGKNKNTSLRRVGPPTNGGEAIKLQYLGWLLCRNYDQFVLNKLASADNSSKHSSLYMQLFALSVMFGKKDLVQMLLHKGLSPHTKLTTYARFHTLAERKEGVISLWMITLVICVKQMINDPNSKSAGILYEILSRHPELDHDVSFSVGYGPKYMLSQEKKHYPQRPEKLSLTQLLSIRNTPESRKLGQLIARHAKRRWWRQLMVSESSAKLGRKFPVDEDDIWPYQLFGGKTRSEKFAGVLVISVGRSEWKDERPGYLHVYM